ncbi:MAG: hypothetical protein R3F54_19050 [Alphaproteobacteria bacterium]
MSRKWGPAARDKEHPDHKAFKDEQRKAKAAATRGMSAQVAQEHGFLKIPKPPGLVVVKATTGLGKTSAAVEEIAKPRASRFDWHAFFHKLLDQSESDFSRKSEKRHARARGRSKEDPLNRTAEFKGEREKSWKMDLMCPRAGTVQPLAAIGINVSEIICPACPLRGVCGYRAQRPVLAEVIKAEGAVFAPSAYIAHTLTWKRGDVTVIDETFVNQLFKEKTIKAAVLGDHEAMWRFHASSKCGNSLSASDGLLRGLAAICRLSAGEQAGAVNDACAHR